MADVYYDPVTRGFYFKELHGNDIPKSTIKTTKEAHQAWLDGQASGNLVEIGGDGQVVPVESEPETLDKSILRISKAVQKYLDQTARNFGYDNITSAVSYAEEESIPIFQNEGKAFRVWRSLVWDYVEKVSTDIRANVVTAPSIESLISKLPKLTLAKTK